MQLRDGERAQLLCGESELRQRENVVQVIRVIVQFVTTVSVDIFFNVFCSFDAKLLNGFHD